MTKARNVKIPDSIVRRTLKHLRTRSSDLITIQSLEQATIMLSCNAALGVISEPDTEFLPHPKSLVRFGNTVSEFWTRNITTSFPTDKSLSRIFCSLLMNLKLGVDSSCLL